MGQVCAAWLTRAPQIGQVRRLCCRSTSISPCSIADSGSTVSRSGSCSGCSQIEHTLAWLETAAPQCGQVRLPRSVSKVREASILRLRRRGAGRDAPHKVHVRADALTSAPQCGQWRFPIPIQFPILPSQGCKALCP